MQNIILTIHLLLALALILTVLLQRSEGGGLGIGGGGKMSTGRPPATPLQKFTWIIALAFIGTSVTLTWLSTRQLAGDSVIERLGTEGVDTGAPILPPALQGDLTPPAASDAPAAPPPAE